MEHLIYLEIGHTTQLFKLTGASTYTHTSYTLADCADCADEKQLSKADLNKLKRQKREKLFNRKNSRWC